MKAKTIFLLTFILALAFVVGNVRATEDLVPLTIAVDDSASVNDVILANDLLSDLQELVNEPYPVDTLKLFSEVDGTELDYQVTVAIFKGQAVTVVGTHSPASHVILAVDIANIFTAMGMVGWASLSKA